MQNANKKRRTLFKCRKSNKRMQVKVRSHTHSHSHLQWIVENMRENCPFVEIYLKKNIMVRGHRFMTSS